MADVWCLCVWVSLHVCGVSLRGGAALIEFFGTLAFFCIHITAITTTTQGGYDHPALAVATVKGITLSLLIFAFANTSGGHFNPVITLSTMFTRLTPAARGVLYMIAQVAHAFSVHACVSILAPFLT